MGDTLGHRLNTTAAKRSLCLALLVALTACEQPQRVAFFPPDAYPEKLSTWGVITADRQTLKLGEGNQIYELNTALFTDYALKLRTIYLPPGTSAKYAEHATFDMPIGTIISKTFFYPKDAADRILLDAQWDGNPANIRLADVKLVETRLLVHQQDGWEALPYIWQGNDAYLNITGELFTFAVKNQKDLNYLVPSRNQCAGCHAENHTEGALKPIGIKARHLNRPDPVQHHQQRNQLAVWQEQGLLSNLPPLTAIPANATWGDADEPLEHRARSYLDINCGHCHNPSGAADTSGLLLDYADHPVAALGVCKPPIAAGRGSGGYLYSIVPGDSEHSILTYRLRTTDPATMMPELGRSLAHAEGHTLIAQWIDAMTGVCL